ncbi:hypothetical protein I0C86_39685 [Plantactinospora sp. S1510]|uniref:Uncharacterized protein n=1 Tax=Plantactinospora alkalitolerans TaxID=2789879 RepID=A0ABS0H946_9ACTN|nr:hypothetical protein [Plantactinospora alkalitolerans]MBF9135002.1 hypothetical protein [Plantactinospora alkalitolerans]
MNDLHELIERALADQPPLSITRETALDAGRRALRRRRRAAAAMGIAAVAAVAAGVVAVPQMRGTETPVGGPSATVDTYEVPQMPAADGVPGAADQPSAVGTDPHLVHFSVPTAAWPVGDVSYSTNTGAGAETIGAGSGLTVTVSRSRGPAEDTANSGSKVSMIPAGSSSPVPPHTTSTPTTVDGNPATLYAATFPDGKFPYFGVLWQPVDGLWVGMFAATEHGETELWANVAALRLDQAQRIVVPFQLTWAPANVRLAGLQAGISTDQPYAFSSANWGDDRGNTFTVSVGGTSRPVTSPRSPGDPAVGAPSGPLQPNRTVAGHKVLWTERRCPPTQTVCEGSFTSDDYDGVPLDLTVTGYDEATASQILTGLAISKDMKDPSTWPAEQIVR